MATVAFEHVEKIYPDGSQAVFDLNLDIADGEFMVLVGPSGCGKTTGLRMVAGLEEISGGEIRIDDEVVNGVEPRKRDVAMVFQNYALYPNMSVFENIAFPLRARRMSRTDVRERVEKAAGLLDLTEHLKRRPKNLSGGQRQRVAMGRAIVRQPKLFLMDEPLSNLDAKLRMQMRGEISRLQRDLGVTTLYVTHDQVEAMTMGHRITVMRKGVLQQCGTPQDLYDNPVNLFVATFIGSPAMNLFRATVERVGDGLVCRCDAGSLPIARDDCAAAALAAFVGQEVAVGVRPEHMALAEPGDQDGPRVAATVSLIEALGSEQLAHLEMNAAPVVTEEVLEIAQDTDAAVVSTLQHEDKAGIVARLSARAKVAAGETVELAIEPDQLHFFDVPTGRAIR